MRSEPARTAARYRARISQLRRWTRVVLIVGTVVSLACAFGPVWVVRAGLVPALAAALISCLLAWREIELERRAHAAAMLAASRRHGEQLTEERRHNAAVVHTMTRHVRAADTVATSRAATILRLNGDIERLQGDINGLRGANSRLTRDLNFRDLKIRELREAIQLRDAELEAARRDAEVAAARHDAEVAARGDRELETARRDAELEAARHDAEVGAARRDAEVGTVRREAELAAAIAGAESELDEDEPLRHRAVVTQNLAGAVHTCPRRTLRDGSEPDSAELRDLEFLAAQAAIAMPNYEDDRRFA